ncbi:D-alanyl-lipoteichoic acid biosynthesis protein DltB [Lactobacillaceae bacterium L1_55_11]|nr:D-alanyl-lipoteichoic acid biosynthesis protein DltB [Lactobacillaceae bacterium L1_55_11]
MPNLQPYADPMYFVYLLIALVPLAVGLYFGKRINWYEVLVSLVFIFLMFDGDASHIHQGYALIVYIIWEALLVGWYTKYRQSKNSTPVFYIVTILSILPIVAVRIAGTGLFKPELSLIGFLGISYLTFRTVGMIIETRDGSIKEFKPMYYLRFVLFMPTLSSGPIDRYRRFIKDIEGVPDRATYLEYLSKAVKYLFLGFLYKFVLAHYFGDVWLPYCKSMALADPNHFWSWWLIPVMYTYGFDLFFDFAGYSLFAVAIGYIMGIDVPMNFNQPFRSKNLKDFWNRWHMTLSFWFRDYVFMRLVFTMMKNKWFKSRITTSNVAYVLNMLLMGFWHGLTWYYITYGLFHGFGLVINDAWLRYKKKHNVPHNKFTEGFAIFLTFNVVMVSFLIFCGFLDTFWFHR